ncbi:MAG: triphosphoribosyl-dephospho-CoA synthase [Planctomycetota bacterium]|nr:triphosphoribosyl-dephospho-CoA synthase [Planctomycetota bacterium]
MMGNREERSEFNSLYQWFAPQVSTAADAIRWACVLEATAPKVGNVSPGRNFPDLSHVDFIRAADIAAEAFEEKNCFAKAILGATVKTSEACRSNVNLGILLLLGPLYRADELLSERGVTSPDQDDWSSAVKDALKDLDARGELAIFEAISVAAAGGLGRAEKWDINESHQKVDLIEAMSLAANKDRIARQYVEDFSDLLVNVVPVLRQSILECRDWLRGIGHAQIRLMSRESDSLIARKNGKDVAEAVRHKVHGLDPGNIQDWVSLDRELRKQGNQLNPGTTADLIAAGLFVLLRSMPESRDWQER